MKAAVIITVCRNWNQYGKPCYHSVMENTDPETLVILFDNDVPSVDNWPTSPRTIAVECGDQSRMGGLTGTWNMGIAMALQQGCDRVVLLNHDTLVNETFRGFIERIGPMSCHGPVSNCPSLPGCHEAQWLPGFGNRPPVARVGLQEVPEINGFCMGIGQAALMMVAQSRASWTYFDPALPFAGNENEWQSRFPGKIHVDHDCFVFHYKAGEWRK